MKIIHFSDPHGGGPAEDWMAYFDKRWVGVFNYRFRRRFRHDLSKLERAVEYILSTRPDVAICTGDLTSSGQPGEFAKVLDVLKPLVGSGIPLYYLPGNHDCYVTRKKCVEAVHHAVDFLSGGRDQFADFPLIRHESGVEMMLLNTSRPSNLLCSWGFVSRQDAETIVQWSETPHTMPRLLLSHYPMIEDHPILRMRHRLFGQQKIIEKMRNGAIDLVLCGHVHRPHLKVDALGHGECCAGSVTRNASMIEITCDVAQKSFSFQQVKL